MDAYGAHASMPARRQELALCWSMPRRGPDLGSTAPACRRFLPHPVWRRARDNGPGSRGGAERRGPVCPPAARRPPNPPPRRQFRTGSPRSARPCSMFVCPPTTSSRSADAVPRRSSESAILALLPNSRAIARLCSLSRCASRRSPLACKTIVRQLRTPTMRRLSPQARAIVRASLRWTSAATISPWRSASRPAIHSAQARADVGSLTCSRMTAASSQPRPSVQCPCSSQ